MAPLTEAQRLQAGTPEGLSALVKAKVIPDRYVIRRLLRIGGMSCTRRPTKPSGKVAITTKLGQPFLTADDGPATLIKLAQGCPRGFRQPSRKAKKWFSTSLLERVCGVKAEFTRSARGDKEAVADAETRELVRATQDLRNIDPKFLSGTQRMRRAMLPPIPPEQTLDAILLRHRLARGEDAADAKAAA